MFKAKQFNCGMFLAVTHSHNEQHRLILAPSARSMSVAFLELLKKNRDARVKECYYGRVIDLPPRYHDVFAERCHAWDFSLFLHNSIAPVAGYCRATGELPPGTEKCACFNNEDPYGNFGICIGGTPECKICHDTSFLVSGRPWEQIYKEHSTNRFEPGSKDYDDFFVMYCDGGHHHAGTTLRQPDILGECDPSAVAGFFAGSRIPTPDEIGLAIAKLADDASQAVERQRVARKKWFLEGATKNLNELANFLGYSEETVASIKDRYLSAETSRWE